MLEGRSPQLVEHFNREYDAAYEHERDLPKEQRFVTKIGPTYAAVGWLLYRDNKYRGQGVGEGPSSRKRCWRDGCAEPVALRFSWEALKGSYDDFGCLAHGRDLVLEGLKRLPDRGAFSVYPIDPDDEQAVS